MDVFEGHEVFFITYEGARSTEIENKYTFKNLGKNPLRFMITTPYVFRLLLKEKPDIIISTGSEITIHVFSITIMFIVSQCKLKEIALAGKIVYAVSKGAPIKVDAYTRPIKSKEKALKRKSNFMLMEKKCCCFQKTINKVVENIIVFLLDMSGVETPSNVYFRRCTSK